MHRKAGAAQGILLCLFSLVSVAAAVLLAAIMPTIVAHFSPVDPAAEGKGLLALAAPSLMVAITSPIIGRVVDAVGRRRVLVVSLVLYGVAGIAPAFLNDLNLIIVSRFFLGIVEGAIMTSSTTLIGDYFSGGEREKWLVMQVVFASAPPSRSSFQMLISYIILSGTRLE
jgi:MFS family permease